MQHENSDGPATLLSSIVSDDATLAARLKTLLEQSRDALARQDPAALESLARQQTECLELLARNEQQRKQLLARAGHHNWPELLRSTDPTLMPMWQATRDCLADVSELVQLNERVVSRSRRTSSRLLALLRGQVDSGGVYNRAGLTRDYGDTRPIASA
jgi:flagellar biosynthesis/type III secretory pathway chaperone